MDASIILASASTTRKKQLSELDLVFEQRPTDLDEQSLPKAHPKSFVYQAALAKLSKAKELFGDHQTIICADSLVEANGKTLSKAKNVAQARMFLELLSEKSANVFTATIIYSPHFLITDLSRASYTFKPFDENAIQGYLESMSWQGKAGACEIEGFCAKYIESSSGSHDVALGLNIDLIKAFLCPTQRS